MPTSNVFYNIIDSQKVKKSIKQVKKNIRLFFCPSWSVSTTALKTQPELFEFHWAASAGTSAVHSFRLKFVLAVLPEQCGIISP